jgi:hypothetical protein
MPRDIEVHWNFDAAMQDLVIVLYGPAELLRAFRTPGDMLSQFVQAVSAQGVGEVVTDSMRVKIERGGFIAIWRGRPEHGVKAKHVNAVMTRVAAELDGVGGSRGSAGAGLDA